MPATPRTTTGAAATRPGPGDATHTGPRKDIQGLRAVAVLLVVAEHLLGRPVGGFIGVDVFFVISGFLITGLLLREHERTGRISFLDFYRRRARRILPAATLVLVVTVAAAWVVLPRTGARSVGVDAVWAFFFAGNYRFATVGTDYFAATAAASPLQHYWSLSVEEQFYFVWPWLMLGLLTVLARSGRVHHARLAAGVTMGLVVVASFLWGLHETAERPAWAYFSTLSRVWELGLGALLAIAAPLLLRMGRRTGAALSWTGLAMIVAGALVVSAEQHFPVPWAALPVVGSALVIAGGVPGPPPYLWPLTNRAMTYVGDVSYSLYLWHFPVIVLLAAVLPPGSTVYYGTALALMALTSVTAYHCFEKVVHHSAWLEPKGRGRRRARISGREVRTHLATVGTSLLACTAVLGVAILVRPVATVDNRGLLEDVVAAPDDGTVQGAWHKDVARALLAEEWPTLTPSIDELDRGELAFAWIRQGCLAYETKALADPIENAERCVFGDPDSDRTMVLYGDSVGISWLPTIEDAFGADWRIEVYTARQCTIADLEVRQVDGGAYPECSAFRDDVASVLAAENPDVLIASSEGDPRQVVGADTTEEAYAALQTALDETAPRLSGLAQQVVYLPPPPTGDVLSECATATSVPADCVRGPGGLPGRWQDMVRSAADATGAAYVDVTGWFCVERVGCPAFVRGTPVRVDGIHLTEVVARQLAPLLAEQLGPRLR